MTASPIAPTSHSASDHESLPIIEEVGLGRSVAIGAAIGMVLAGIGVTIGLLASGLTTSESLGVGLMAAFWGGIGFGTMVGGVVFLSKHE